MKSRKYFHLILILAIFSTCKKEELATVTTNPVTAVTGNSAISGGIITGEKITEKGVCWGLQPDPTVNDNKTSDGAGEQRFESKITGLQSSTTYYVRAYASNESGTAYGDALTFTTKFVAPVTPTTGSVTDIDGNTYPTIILNGQEWMAWNLKTTHYRNGDLISHLNDPDDWEQTPGAAFCYYNEDNSNFSTYGALYNWYATNDARNIAPIGWHVPTANEWQQLITFLGGPNLAYNKMRSKVGWTSISSSPATNETGFSATAGGFRNDDGTYVTIGTHAFFWAYTPLSTIASYGYDMTSVSLTYKAVTGHQGLSVRCVKD